MKKVSEEKKQEILFLLNWKNRTGMIMYSILLGVILIIVGLICPMCSYNPTKLDITKVSVYINELPLYVLIGVAIVAIVFLLPLITVVLIAKDEWRTKTKKYIFISAVSIVLSIIAVGIFAVACTFYEPESFSLEPDLDVGYYLISIGTMWMSAMFLWFCIELKRVADEKIKLEDLVVIKNKNGEQHETAKNTTLTQKLEELKNLKDNGMITDNEYEEKKKELMENYK